MILPVATTLPSGISTINCLFYEDVVYKGVSRGIFDFFKPKGGATTKPLMIFIHGGGYISGSSAGVYNYAEAASGLDSLIDADIAVISLNYRYVDTDGTEREGVRKAYSDVRDAIQRIKFNADLFGIDKNNICFYGKSAGAGMSMYFSSNNLALAGSSTFRGESTLPNFVAVKRPQPLNFRKWENFFTTWNLTSLLANEDIKNLMYPFYGKAIPTTGNSADFDTNEMRNYARRLDHHKLFKPTGIPVYVENSDSTDEPTEFGDLIHHPNFSQKFKDIADLQGEDCTYVTNDPPEAAIYTWIINKLTT